MQLLVHPWNLTIAKLAAISDRASLSGSAFVSLTQTPDEISLVCEAAFVPADVISINTGWSCLAIAGTLDFALTGVLAPIAQCLAEQRISIFAISTYDTDVVLVKTDTLQAACAALKAAGYDIHHPGA